MRAELARALRRIKPQRFTRRLDRRSLADLPSVSEAPAAGPALLLDTCVYVAALEDSLPTAAETLLRSRTLVHLSVVLGELAHNFGRLDPARADTKRHLAALQEVISDIPPHRLEAVTAETMLEAGILAGLVFRVGGFGPGQEVSALNDAAIYLHAIARGYMVLTANVRDFDLLEQVLPTARVLFYRPAAVTPPSPR